MLRFLIYVLAILLVAYLLPGISVDGIYIAVITALLLGLCNVFIRPILVLLTLPITILTLGLFALVINALLFWFVSSFVDGFDVAGLGWALLGTILISIVTSLGNKMIDS